MWSRCEFNIILIMFQIQIETYNIYVFIIYIGDFGIGGH